MSLGTTGRLAEGHAEENGLVAFWGWPAGEAPATRPVVVALEQTASGWHPLVTGMPIEVEPRRGGVPGSEVDFWIVLVRVPGGTAGRRFELRIDGGEPIQIAGAGGALESGTIESAAAVEDLDLRDLRDLLDQQPDGGRAILKTLGADTAPDQVRAEIDRALDEAPSALEITGPFPRVDEDELREFNQACGTDITVAQAKETHFQEIEDAIAYLTTKGGTAYHVLGRKVAAPLWRAFADPASSLTYPVAEDPAQAPLRLALYADNGNRLYASRAIARQISAGGYPYAFHLGDVYYGGTADEFEHFRSGIDDMLDRTELFLLAGNHEMYARGEPFQKFIVDKQRQFGDVQRQRAEFFRLKGDGFQIIGIDTMWTDWEGGKLRRETRLSPDTRDALSTWLADTESNELTILLTSNQPWHLGDRTPASFLEQVRSCGRVDLWFWGNVHYGALYDTYAGEIVGSCIGHGGFPFYRWREPGALPDGVSCRWLETGNRFWPYENVRPDVGLNGWCEAVLTRDGTEWTVRLTYRDWVGRERCVAHVTKSTGQPPRVSLEGSAPG